VCQTPALHPCSTDILTTACSSDLVGDWNPRRMAQQQHCPTATALGQCGVWFGCPARFTIWAPLPQFCIRTNTIDKTPTRDALYVHQHKALTSPTKALQPLRSYYNKSTSLHHSTPLISTGTPAACKQVATGEPKRVACTGCWSMRGPQQSYNCAMPKTAVQSQ
jgi:hypothetical protein